LLARHRDISRQDRRRRFRRPPARSDEPAQSRRNLHSARAPGRYGSARPRHRGADSNVIRQMISHRAQFGELFRLFRQRFVESEALAPSFDRDYNTNLWQVLSVLAIPGFYAAIVLGGAIVHPEASQWTLRSVRIFVATYSFAVAGFAALFEWDMLFPERRDFLVLTLFPIRMRDLFASKIAALGVLLGVLTLSVNAGAVAVLTLALAVDPHARNLRFAGTAGLFVVSSGAAATFGFLLVAVVQGVLINVTPVRLFRRISPWVQLIGMSLMVLSFILFPLFINVV